MAKTLTELKAAFSLLNKDFEEALAGNQESADFEEIATFNEAGPGSDGLMEVKLIAPGTGAMGHYTAECLQQAAADKVFPKSTQMFLDHPTAAERLQSGSGAIRKLAAVTEGDAVWKDNGKEGPGLYAPIKVYKDFVSFIKERAKDIGVSVSVVVQKSKDKIVGGVPLVERLLKGVSTDFVSRAGAGGKIVTMYESFRDVSHHQEDDMGLTAEQENLLKEAGKLVPQFAALQTENANLKKDLERVQEANQLRSVSEKVSSLVRESGLPAKSQDRVMRQFGVNYTVPVTDGKIDMTKVEEAAKAAIKEEVDWFKENGVTLKPVVQMAGGGGGGTEITQEAKTAKEKIVTEAAKSFENSINSLAGVKKAS